MKTRVNHLSSILILMITVAGASQLRAGENKKVLTMDDCGLWRTVSSTQLSSDGKWMTYDYSKPEADKDAPDERNLQIKHLASDKVYRVSFGISPVFSDDAGWVAYKIDLRADVIDEITFTTDQGQAGNLKFSYLQSIEGAGREFSRPNMPRRHSSPRANPGLLWLVQLVEDSFE